MHQYLDQLADLVDHGRKKADRTGTGTRSLFGRQMRFDLNDGFPLLTTKKLHTRSIFIELLWFLRGDTNIKYLTDNGVTIWNEWADANGDLGPVYGAQWRRWRTAGNTTLISDELCWVREIDQISNVLESLQSDPFGRRHIVSAWNPADIPNMALPPCHCLFQFYVDELTHTERLVLAVKTVNENVPSHSRLAYEEVTAWLDSHNVPRLRLSCQLYQRSADFFLGVPFNLASYALLTHMFAQQLNYAVGDFVWTGGDVHLYENHIEQAELQLERKPTKLPQLILRKAPDLFSYTIDDIVVEDYVAQPHIKAQVAV